MKIFTHRQTFLYHRFEGAGRFVDWVSHKVNIIAACALMGVVLLVVSNICIRLFTKPLLGAPELVGLLGVILVSFAMAYTLVVKGHITVPLVVSRLPTRSQAVVDSITNLVSIGIIGLITWRSFLQGSHLWASGQVTGALLLPLHPFLYALGVAFALLTVAFVIDFAKSLLKAVRK